MTKVDNNYREHIERIEAIAEMVSYVCLNQSASPSAVGRKVLSLVPIMLKAQRLDLLVVESALEQQLAGDLESFSDTQSSPHQS